MPTENSDSLNITSLKFRDDSLSSPFQGVQFGVVGLYSSISAGLLFSSSLPVVSAGLISSSLLFDVPRLICSLK